MHDWKVQTQVFLHAQLCVLCRLFGAQEWMNKVDPPLEHWTITAIHLMLFLHCQQKQKLRNTGAANCTNG